MSAEQKTEPVIRILSEVVQNKIAAGEVVERPASVVKELVENAIDAGADSITTEIEEGGMRLIKVSDNGCGMNRENLANCIERHATSKISDVDDIFKITTMGFRGEALPSIGAVSRLSISTATPGSETGLCLKVCGGQREEIAPSPPRKGTVIEVRDLFFNTPARRKFMKSASAEVAAINETVTRLALANHKLSFKIINSGKQTLQLPAHNTLAERITALFGSSLQLLPIDRTTSDGALKVTGFCARPPESRANSRFIYTFLNNRWIKHPGLARAAADAYQGSLPPRRYPFAVIMLEISPEAIDVNAHPTKEIVRFENESLIVGGMRKAIDEALRGGSFTAEVERARLMREQQQNRTFSAAADFMKDRPQLPSFRESPVKPSGSTNYSAPEKANTLSFSSPRGLSPNTAQSPESKFSSTTSQPRQVAEAAFSLQHQENAESCSGTDTTQTKVTNTSPAQLKLLEEVSCFNLLAQAGGKYLILEKEDGLMIVDQHALHERWNYDRLKEKELTINSQRLLLPCEIQLTPAESSLADQALEPLTRAGFELEQTEGCLKVLAHPEIVPPRKIEQVVRDVLADLEHAPLEEFKEKFIASLACHSAVLFGTPLSEDACLSLLEKYKDGSLLTCPHGRPTSIFLSWKELASRFGR